MIKKTSLSFRKKILIGSSLIVSIALVVHFFGALVAGFTGERLLTVFFDTIWISFACGALTGLLWGRSNLDGINVVLYPGGVLLALFVFLMPISLTVDYFEVGRVRVLESSETILEFVGMFSSLVSITFFPLLGPVLTHAYRNSSTWPQIKQDLKDAMKRAFSGLR